MKGLASVTTAEDRRASGELAGLIQAAIDAGATERELERRAERAGETISHSQLNKYRRGLVTKAPDGGQQTALAAALNVPEQVVRRAVIIDWFGWDPADLGVPVPEVKYTERIDMLLEALGTRLMLLPEAVQRETVNKIMREYVIGA